jgi:hypothetical protein
VMKQHLDAGTPVYDVAGRRVGIVGLNNPYEDHVVVQKGWLFPREVYLPLVAIDRGDRDGVYLRLHKHELQDPSYRHPPLEGATHERERGENAS